MFVHVTRYFIFLKRIKLFYRLIEIFNKEFNYKRNHWFLSPFFSTFNYCFNDMIFITVNQTPVIYLDSICNIHGDFRISRFLVCRE